MRPDFKIAKGDSRILIPWQKDTVVTQIAEIIIVSRAFFVKTLTCAAIITKFDLNIAVEMADN